MAEAEAAEATTGTEPEFESLHFMEGMAGEFTVE